MKTPLAVCLLTIVILAGAARGEPLPPEAMDYSTDLKLKIAVAISPRSPPIRLHLDWIGGARPTVIGTTSLPDGAILMIFVRKPWLPDGPERLSIGLPACKDDCSPLSVGDSVPGDMVVIRNGTFRSGPHTVHGDGKALDPGLYPFEIILQTGNTFGPPSTFLHMVAKGQLRIVP